MSTGRKTKTPATMTELRDAMLDVWAELRSGDLETGTAKELSNAAGKIIKSAAVQIEYSSLRKETPDIPFLK